MKKLILTSVGVFIALCAFIAILYFLPGVGHNGHCCGTDGHDGKCAHHEMSCKGNCEGMCDGKCEGKCEGDAGECCGMKGGMGDKCGMEKGGCDHGDMHGGCSMHKEIRIEMHGDGMDGKCNMEKMEGDCGMHDRMMGGCCCCKMMCGGMMEEKCGMKDSACCKDMKMDTTKVKVRGKL